MAAVADLRKLLITIFGLSFELEPDGEISLPGNVHISYRSVSH